ncbi:MAG: hypothetical protein U9R50_07630, partial [Campylobacterota bacterium]|nr:hypothetical protein [Campylobacterota bacterium]
TLSAYEGSIKSLIGIEAGYGQFEYSADNADNINMGRNSSSEDFGHLGLKIGAESDEYRLFLDAKYYHVGGDFDYANSIGGSFQYLLSFTENMNFFFGINGGLMNLKVVDDSIGVSYEYSDPYIGGDIGFNLELSEKLGLELGLRYLNINAENTQYYIDDESGETFSRTYTVEQMINLYASVIFKFYVD